MTTRIITIKKRAAIHQFVECILRETQNMTIRDAVSWTLYAERLQPDKLYALLKKRGYRWHSQRRAWVLPATNKKTG